jgi:hypothetical protein
MADQNVAGVAANVPEEIRAAMAHVQDAWQAAQHAVGAMDAVFHGGGEGHVDAEAAEPGHGALDVHVLTDAAHQIEADLGQAFSTAIHALESEFTQATQELQSQYNALQSAQHDLQAGLTELQHGCEQAGHSAQEAFKTLETTVADLQQQGEAALKEFADAAQQLHTGVSKGFGEASRQASEHFNETLSSQELQKLTQGFSDLFRQLEAGFSQFSDHADHALQTFSSDLQSAFHDLSNQVSHEVRDQIDHAGQQLIHDGIEKLAQSVAVAVAEAEVGAEISAAMSPYLPEIIIVRRATDAIKELIQVYHELQNLKDNLGPLGGLF